MKKSSWFGTGQVAAAPDLHPQAWLCDWARILSPQPPPKEESYHLVHPPSQGTALQLVRLGVCGGVSGSAAKVKLIGETQSGIRICPLSTVLLLFSR